LRVLESLNRGLHELMESNPNLHVIGEDILDPYGGAFKVTKGLSTNFPDRVLTTPVSEAAIIGFATGMAMHGKPTIAEIMFGDFLALCFDAILNHASKFTWMYNEQVKVPLIIRTPMGGYRGYGPTHSQSIEKHFCGIPGFNVYALNRFTDAGKLLQSVFATGEPSLLIENKVLYAKPEMALPTYASRPGQTPDVAIISYGYSVDLAVEVAAGLQKEEELCVDVVPLTRLSPFPIKQVVDAAMKCKRVLVVEEGTASYNIGSECARHLIGLVDHFDTVSAALSPIPSSRARELDTLPSVDIIQQRIIEIC
jgi:pyruvate/2-oxoglutarate/acetoin dehydrogenase E1 component